ncbi:MAG: SH3 domain-containing protein [Bauldia sp.]|nr:SH3 domain-containing protein [Bauldia sp.]MCW5718788.1 SH3 domain-containing protein [Bauldia sp.]
MQRQKLYSPFLRGWIAITVLVVALFAMAVPSLAQTGLATATTAVNMRNGPGTSYAVITVVPRGGPVSVDNCLTSGWCAVVYGNRAGFISRNYLAFGGATPPVQQPPVVTGSVQAQTTVQLNMRTGPGTQYGVIRAVPAGGVVSLIQCTPGYSWCEGTYQGSRGWMSGQYLRSTNPQYATQPVTNVGAQLGLQLFNLIAGQLGLNVTINTPPRAPNAGEVCLYTDPNFGGQAICARMGQSDANLVAPFNDSISSIRFGSGAFVEICQNPGFTGVCRSYNSDIAQLPALMNDRTSSFRTTVVAPGPGPQPVGGQACFYSEFNFTGQYFCLDRNQSLAFVGNNWNDLISSIRVDQGVTVQVCGDADFGGFCEQYTTSQAFLPPGRDNAVSSIRVR